MKRQFNIKSKEKIKKWYEDKDIASAYLKKRFNDPLGRLRHVKQIEVINKEIRKNQPKNVLDIACGPARITADLRGNFDGLAVDNSEEMLKIAKTRVKNKKWQFKKIDAFKVSEINQKFDLITSFRFVRHFNNEERKKLYSEIRKLLSDKGLFIFDVVNKKKWNFVRNLGKLIGKKDSMPVYDKFYMRKEIENELRNNGFKIVKIKPSFNYFLIEYAIAKFFSFLRLNKLGFYVIYLIDKIKSMNPYEWTVVCKKE